jgi:hypothetical protein
MSKAIPKVCKELDISRTHATPAVRIRQKHESRTRIDRAVKCCMHVLPSGCVIMFVKSRKNSRHNTTCTVLQED